MDVLLFFYVFLVGALVGSFLNVVIHRVPREESIVSPASACPACGEKVRWYDNIPLVSWVLLAARCRFCESPISVRYPIVETGNAVLWTSAYAWFGLSLPALILALIFSLLIALIFIDLDTQFLPDVMNYPALVLALLLPLTTGALERDELLLSPTVLDALLGAAAGGGLIALVSFSYFLLRGDEGMGRGDIKLMAVVGALGGWKAVIPVLFLASFLGAAIGLGLGARQKKGMQVALPFGPFIGIALLATVFFGPEMFAWFGVI